MREEKGRSDISNIVTKRIVLPDQGCFSMRQPLLQEFTVCLRRIKALYKVNVVVFSHVIIFVLIGEVYIILKQLCRKGHII